MLSGLLALIGAITGIIGKLWLIGLCGDLLWPVNLLFIVFNVVGFLGEWELCPRRGADLECEGWFS